MTENPPGSDNKGQQDHISNSAATDEHTHEWQPNGSVEVSRWRKSPCSTWDDEFWLDVISLAVCRCGAIKRDRIGTKDYYRRGDKLRKN